MNFIWVRTCERWYDLSVMFCSLCVFVLLSHKHDSDIVRFLFVVYELNNWIHHIACSDICIVFLLGSHSLLSEHYLTLCNLHCSGKSPWLIRFSALTSFRMLHARPVFQCTKRGHLGVTPTLHFSIQWCQHVTLQQQLPLSLLQLPLRKETLLLTFSWVEFQLLYQKPLLLPLNELSFWSKTRMRWLKLVDFLSPIKESVTVLSEQQPRKVLLPYGEVTPQMSSVISLLRLVKFYCFSLLIF